MNSNIRELVKGIAESVPGNVLVYSAHVSGEHEVLYARESMKDVFNVTKEEFDEIVTKGQIVKMFFTHAGIDPTKIDYRSFKEDNHTYRLSTPKGYIWIRAISRSIYEDEEEVVILTILNDISHETSGYETLIQTSKDLIAVYRIDTKRIIYTGEYFASLVGKSVNEIIDMKIHESLGYASYGEYAESIEIIPKGEYYYNEKNNRYFEVDIIDLNWRDNKSKALILHDVTSLIEEKNKMELSYKMQIEARMKSSPDVFMAYHIDLNTGLILDQVDSISKTNYVYYPDALSHIIDCFLSQKEKAEIMPQLRIKNLVNIFRLKKEYISFDCTVNLNGMTRFTKLSVRLLKNPTNNHIEAFITNKDTTSSKMTSLIDTIVLEKEYDQVGIIMLGKRSIYYQTSSRGDENLPTEKEMDYYQCLNYIAENYISKESVLSFISSANLDNIKHHLETNGKYSFITRKINRKGEFTGYSRCSYNIANEELGLVLFCVESITKEIELDSVTNHINRQGFIREANDFISQMNNREEYALLYLNINGFKAINENFSHKKCDGLLKDILDSLLSSKLNPIMGARIEADNYALLVHKCDVDLKYIKEKILNYTGTIDFGEVNLRCGVYYLTNDTSINISGMYDRAKLAVVYGRDDFSDNLVVFSENMNIDYVSKNDVLADFNDALARGEFKVYYQPVVDIKTGKICSAEALIRWKKDDGSVISPGLFVPVIEEAGYISKLDNYVINHTINFIARRFTEGKNIVPISVNMSRKDFFDERMIDSYLETMYESPIPKNMFRIEITESAYFEIQNKGRKFLNNVRGKGGNILIDDFGSGASSFSTLRDYDFDILKLDIGFIRRIGVSSKDDKIIVSVIDMAKKLDLKIIAEGVETKEQVDFLLDNDCDYVQGYYYYKPVPEEEFEGLLN